METLEKRFKGLGLVPVSSLGDLDRIRSGISRSRLRYVFGHVSVALWDFLKFIPKAERVLGGICSVGVDEEQGLIRVVYRQTLLHDCGNGEALLRKSRTLASYLRSRLDCLIVKGLPPFGFVWHTELPPGFSPKAPAITLRVDGVPDSRDDVDDLLDGYDLALLGYHWDGMEIFYFIPGLVAVLRSELPAEVFYNWDPWAGLFNLVAFYDEDEHPDYLMLRIAEFLGEQTPFVVDFHGDYKGKAELVGRLIVRRPDDCTHQSFTGLLYRVKV